MSEQIDTISNFLQSGIGVTLQVIAIIGSIIPLMKYFNGRFDKRVQDEITKRINPLLLKTCNELIELKHKQETYQLNNDTCHKYINEKIQDLHDILYPKREGAPSWKNG